MKRRNAFALALLAFVAALAAHLGDPHLSGVTFAMAVVGTTGPGAAPTSAPGDGTGAVSGNINEAMKIIFEEPLTNSITADSELLDLFEQDTNVKVNETTGGRYIEMAHYFALPAGVGARTLEGDYIPVPSGPKIRNSQVYLKKIEGTVEMSGDVMRRVRQGEGAFVTWANRALPDLKERVDNELDRMLLGYGAGIKARINDIDPDDADLTIGIDAALGIAGLEPAWLQFLEGESVVFGPTADGLNLRDSGAAYSIEDIDIDTGHLVLGAEPSATVADSDFIFAGDAAGNSGGEKEIMGLHGMVDDGTILATFQGLARASYRLWNGQIIDGSAAPASGELTEILLTKADDDTAIRGKGEIDCLVMSRTTARNFWANLLNDKRLVDPRTYSGGKGGLEMMFNNKTLNLKVCRKMPDTLVFGLDTSTMKHWRNTGWEWDDITGSIWNRATDATGRRDAFYAVGHIVLQTGCIAPAKNFKIDGLLATY